MSPRRRAHGGEHRPGAQGILQKYDSEAGYHLTRMNEATNKKYQEKLNTTKLKPFKWGWEDNGED